jgi:UDP-N-acetylmuramoyl-L-alanyl-D-glutamate--2,6-diaminopimelate ligase
LTFESTLNIFNAMDLEFLLNELTEKEIIGNPKGLEVTGVAYDPLRVESGFIYVAINIYTQLDKVELPDGHPFVDDAVARGAIAIVVQKDVSVARDVIKVKVPDSRYALAMLANKFYNYPSRQLKLIGVTGTNGKTTTTHIIESIFIQKFTIGLIGTLYYKLQGVIHKSKDTTPEPTDLQAIFREIADRKFDFCVLEASSHGIDFHRIAGCKFDIAVFTNLSQDHLDYHHTMDHYLNTKLKLFKALDSHAHAIVNIDDPVGHKFVKATKANILTYGIDNQAEVMAKNIRLSINHTNYTIITPKGEMEVQARLVGLFNVYNALAAVAAALTQGLDLDTIKSGLESEIRVAGRFELVDKGQDFAVIVDYAHTPDGFTNVLELAKQLKPRKLITIFGCGGDRDREKRPIMGEIASKYSDQVVITADNPRDENPMDIANDIIAGIKNSHPVVIPDRREAIETTLRNAKKNDMILILGKGHETTQIIKDQTF